MIRKSKLQHSFSFFLCPQYPNFIMLVDQLTAEGSHFLLLPYQVPLYSVGKGYSLQNKAEAELWGFKRGWQLEERKQHQNWFPCRSIMDLQILLCPSSCGYFSLTTKVFFNFEIDPWGISMQSFNELLNGEVSKSSYVPPIV